MGQPLTFASPADYDHITGNDKISILGLAGLAEGVPLVLRVTPGGGGAPFEIGALHTFNEEQIQWFKHGSALNVMKSQMQSRDGVDDVVNVMKSQM